MTLDISLVLIGYLFKQNRKEKTMVAQLIADVLDEMQYPDGGVVSLATVRLEFGLAMGGKALLVEIVKNDGAIAKATRYLEDLNDAALTVALQEMLREMREQIA